MTRTHASNPKHKLVALTLASALALTGAGFAAAPDAYTPAQAAEDDGFMHDLQLEGGHWVGSGDKLRYQKGDGSYVQGGELELIGDQYYMFDSNGYMRRNQWANYGSTIFYLSDSGAAYTGWLNIDGSWFYLGPILLTGWQNIDGTWYWFNPGGDANSGVGPRGTNHGVMQTGWFQYPDGTWYYFQPSGAMVTGWQQIGGSWYYFNGSGAMQTGWLNLGGTWYYLTGSGAMATGWINLGGTWYYLSGSGAMVTGWQQIGGTWYWFDGSGALR